MPFLFQGQYYDYETGLAYNRFRYYDPELGSYISQDPIGLSGNNPTFYAYVEDTNTWLDVWGLKNDNNNRTAPILLGDGYRARRDRFNYKEGKADFEIHIYKERKSGQLIEIGIVNSDGNWINKHKHNKNDMPDLPQKVKKKLKSYCNKKK